MHLLDSLCKACNSKLCLDCVYITVQEQHCDSVSCFISFTSNTLKRKVFILVFVQFFQSTVGFFLLAVELPGCAGRLPISD